jgi:hypothetical protein
MFKIFLSYIVLSIIICALFTSCDKTGYTIVKTTADSATQIITANDELDVNYEFDQAINEALLATTLSTFACGEKINQGTENELYTTLNQVIIDTSEIIDSALIRLTYYGKNADQTKGRSGVITLHFARDNNGKIIPWKNPGASININFEQYEVIVLANNKSIWMNGSSTIINVSGGLLQKASDITLNPGDTLKDNVSGNIAFTYNDNVNIIQTWTWYINQVRKFTIQNAILTSSINGDSSINGSNDISTSGTTRFGSVFYTQTIAPVVQTISSLYILSNPISGEKAIHGIPEPLSIEYGVDSNGNPVSGISPYGYKISWISNGGQAVTIVSY